MFGINLSKKGLPIHIRGTENAKIECAKLFFDVLSEDGYKVYFHDQLNNKQMAQIIKEVLRDN